MTYLEVLAQDKAEIIGATVDFVNSIRSDLGFTPITTLSAGVRDDAVRCPTARSICHPDSENYRVVVLTEKVYVGNYREYTNPPLVEKFIEYFDDGNFPELEEA